ncbi:MAG: antibiotic biosynthesis monooxygenase [Fimbriimonadaceae bacterium]|nr:antibiotic biosynthesis monooxygenase [Fimbriimonadaceae bacterium]
MELKPLICVAVGVTIGAGLFAGQGQDKALTVQDFPDLVSGIKATPGCLGVKTGTLENGKQLAIYAWFKDKAAVQAWYTSPMHREAMKKFFPKLPGKTAALGQYRDDKSPLLVVATVTPSDKSHLEGSPLAVSQIAIEIYTPVPGGVTFGGGFAPKSLDVPGIVRMGE